MNVRLHRRWRWLAGLVTLGIAGAAVCRALADPWPAPVTLGSAEEEAALAFSPGGDLFLTSDGVAINLWDCGTGRRRDTWAVPGGGVAVEGAYSPDGTTFAAIVRNNHVPARLVLFDVATGRARASTPTRFDRDAGLGYVADGSAILFGSTNGSGIQEVVVCDAATGRVLSATRPAPPIAGSAVGARTLGYFPQRGGPITLERVGPGPPRPPVVASPTAARSTGAFDLAPDGRRCAIARLDGTIEIRDLLADRPVATLRAHSGLKASCGLRFAPDGRTLFSRAMQPNPPGTAAKILMLQLDNVRDSLDPAGPLEDTVVLDAATGRVLARSRDARYFHFSPDGRTVASIDRDGRVRLRDYPHP